MRPFSALESKKSHQSGSSNSKNLDGNGVPKDFFYNADSHNVSINDTMVNHTVDELNATRLESQSPLQGEEHL